MNEYKEPYKPAEHLELNPIEEKSSKVFKTIHCPSCKEVINTDDLSLDKNLGKCGSCNVIFSIEDDIQSLIKKETAVQEIFRPEGIELFKFRDELEITIQPHLQGVDLYGIIFMPMIALFSIFVYFAKDIAIYYPIAFSLATLYFIYKSINYKKNKIYIDINDNYLDLKSRPKNLKKDKSFNAEDIDQLYLKYAADGSGYYSIFMITNSDEGQKHQKLITLNTLSKAKYLEQEIEKYLNIKNRKVAESNV